MKNETRLSLKEAKRQFISLLENINENDKVNFIKFAFEELACGDGILSDDDDACPMQIKNMNEEILDDPVAKLIIIANDIKNKVPISAILPSESIIFPTSGENADCVSNLTVHVDEFLYDDDEVEELVEDDKLRRNYCKDCGSKNIAPLIYISHSMSRDGLYYIFNTCLPTLENKTVLDIGSRLGAILYGAYVFTDASRIIGVEMNEDLCKLQNEIIKKYKMDDRIEVLNKKIEEDENVVKLADVILINNAFEFYVSEEKQIEIWQFLRCHMKSKTILVTSPHLETVIKNLKIDKILNEWVKPLDLESEEDPEFCSIGFYEVL